MNIPIEHSAKVKAMVREFERRLIKRTGTVHLVTIVPLVPVKNNDNNELAEVIKKYVLHSFSVTWDEITSASRKADFVNARHTYCYLLRMYAKMQLKSIAAKIQKDHTTIIYACKHIKDMVDTKDEKIAEIVDRFVRTVKPTKNEI